MDNPGAGIIPEHELVAAPAVQAESAPIEYEAAVVHNQPAQVAPEPQLVQQAGDVASIPTMEEAPVVEGTTAPVGTHAAGVHAPASFGHVLELAVKNVNISPESAAHDLEAEVLNSQGYFQSAA